MSRKVLILRPGAMGDVCMAVPFVTALARRCEVHWLLHRVYEPIARGFATPCRIIPLEPSPSAEHRASLLRHLQDEHYHAVLDLAHWPNTAQIVQALPDVPVRAITFDPDQDARLGVNPHRLDLYAPFNVRVGVPATAHQVSKWLLLAREALGLELAFDWPLPVARAPGREFRVFVHPHASKPEKEWPADRFAEVLRGLKSPRRLRCWINSGSRRELPAALGLWLRLRASGVRARIVWLERTCVRLRTALERADLALGCDSGPMHFAALLGTPTVVVCGPYEPEEFGPLWRSIPVTPPRARMPARLVPAPPVLRACRLIADGVASFGPRRDLGSAA